MSLLLFENNFQTTLLAGIGASDTTMTLTSAAGLPTIVGDQYFVLSLFDAATKLITEIVYVTALSGATATITRAQEGTTARVWNAGDIVAGQWTAGQAATMVQQFQMQAQAGNYAVAGGTANAITAAFTPALTSHIVGAPLRVLLTATNGSGGVTFNPGPSAVTVLDSQGNPLIAGDLQRGALVDLIYNGTNYQFFEVLAQTNRPGIVPLATDAQAIAGTDTQHAVTPHALAAALGTINSVPVGAVMAWTSTTPPAGWLECNGATLSTSTYAALFAVLGYTWGGSGANFGLPDTRGYFLRGWSHGTGVDVGRFFATYQNDAFASHTHGYVWYSNNSGGSGPGHGGDTATPATTTATGAATETRPINVAVMWIIKY